jgi:ankyrin repeat protein
LTAGANVNEKNDLGTPLYCAASSECKEIAELLIANGADVKAKNDDGWTPLFCATALLVVFFIFRKTQ